MKTLVTACGRPDLLTTTIVSLNNGQRYSLPLDITVHEDTTGPDFARLYTIPVSYTKGLGQHKSIELFINRIAGEKFYLHVEDDWLFENSYDWIGESIKIMESDPMVIKVLARRGSPHPCIHDHELVDMPEIQFGYIEPWRSPDGIKWHGFSWNPGVTRLDILKQFMPFPKWEQDLAEKIYKAGFRVVELANPVYQHIGDGRSTH